MRYLSILLIFVLVFSLFISCSREEEKEEIEETKTSTTDEIGGVKVGDMVFAQWIEGEGEVWEQAEITGIEDEDVHFEWVDTFNKDAPEATTNYKKVSRVEPLDAQSIEAGMSVLIHPPDKPDWAYYKGEIVEQDEDQITVKFLDKDEEQTVKVKSDNLWKFQ